MVEEVALVEVIGDIDAKTAQAVQEKILPLAQPGSKILMDMTEVRYMSTAGFRVLVLLSRQASAQNVRFVLVSMTCIFSFSYRKSATPGLCSRPHERERWLSESSSRPLCTSLPRYTSPHRAFGTVNTRDTSPDARAVHSSLGRVIRALARLTVSRNSFVRFSLMPIVPDFFSLILANTTN